MTVKLTLTPTREIRTVDGAPARIWLGQDERGTPVIAAIRFVQPQTHSAARLQPFVDALREIEDPQPLAPPARISLRTIL